ncbi:hypothetical protein PQR52_37190, partial [Paraburkholderia aspalathi]|uniref:hypothetical protein n=1 Tax=Paraburkholderia aspalathi TaxID=1324617 RepID=UPI0038B9ED09
SRSSLRVVVHLESVFVPVHLLVTRASYFRRRCARRRAVHRTDRYVLAPRLTADRGWSLHRGNFATATATATGIVIVIGTATATRTVTGPVIAAHRHII